MLTQGSSPALLRGGSSTTSRRVAPQRGRLPGYRGPSCVSQSMSSTGVEAPSAGEATGRRPLLLGALSLLTAWEQLNARPSQASEGAVTAEAPAAAVASASSAATRYEDEFDKFGLEVPKGWVQAEGSIGGSLGGFTASNGTRRTVAFFPADVPASEVSVSVTVTNVSFEFTKLGSFGNVATFAQNLVNSLDQSFLLRRPSWAKRDDQPVQLASLVDYSESDSQYYVEYTVQKLPEPQRHLLSKVALGSNGTYNRLYTLTAQCSEADLPKYRSTLEAAVNSFTANVKPMM